MKMILIRGLPGSGKSTLAKSKIANDESYVHIETDMYFEQSGEYKFDRDKLQEAHDWCKHSTEDYIKNGFNVIVSNTFIKLWEIIPYFQLAVNYKLEIEIIKCINEFSNIHNVPLEVLSRMKDNFEDSPKETIFQLGEKS